MQRRELKGKPAFVVHHVLRAGKHNAICARDLCNIFGINTRTLTAAIEYERRKMQAPICATCNSTNPGYYIAASPDEIQEYCRRLKRREAEIRKTRRACEKMAAAEMGAQNEAEANRGK